MSVSKAIYAIPRFVWKIILYTLSILLGLLYILSVSSPYVPPTKFILPALSGLLFEFILLGQVLLFIYWLIKKRWGIVCCYLLLFALSYPVLSDYIALNIFSSNSTQAKHQTNKTKKTIKLLSYNTYVFGYKGHSKKNPNPVLKYIKESNADLVCLQEASYTVRVGSYIRRHTLHNYLKKEYPYINEQVAQNDGSMIMLLSKYPIKKVKRLPIRSRANGAVAFCIDINGKKVLLIGVHLESFRLNRKRLDLDMNSAKRGDINGLKQTICRKIAPTIKAHNIQANLIHRVIEKCSIPNVIVCGDFNDTPLSYTYHKIRENLTDAYLNCAFGFGFSIRTSIFAGRIDHIFYNKSFNAINCQIDTRMTASDHAPIIAELEWKEEE